MVTISSFEGIQTGEAEWASRLAAEMSRNRSSKQRESEASDFGFGV